MQTPRTFNGVDRIFITIICTVCNCTWVRITDRAYFSSWTVETPGWSLLVVTLKDPLGFARCHCVALADMSRLKEFGSTRFWNYVRRPKFTSYSYSISEFETGLSMVTTSHSDCTAMAALCHVSLLLLTTSVLNLKCWELCASIGVLRWSCTRILL